MPHLPESVIDAMEKLLSSKFFDAVAKSITVINPEILEMTFSANLSKIDFHIGWAVMLRIGPKDLRHYTVSNFEKQKGLFKILFYLHGNGPGSDFVEKLKEGDKVKMAVPGGRKMFVPDSSRHFFFGDETSLSFIQIFMEEVQRLGAKYLGIVELSAQNIDVPKMLNMNIATVVTTPTNNASEAIAYLKKITENPSFDIHQYVFYLTGNVKSVHLFRNELKKLNVNSKNIKFQGYWAEGSVGL